jgi:hypothetical protein
MSVRYFALLPLATLAPLAAQISAAPCFETALGANLGLGDEAVAANNALGFLFPGPAGSVSSIDIASNGFVWLGSNPQPRCCDGTGFQFVSDPPSIAAMWEDLDPSHAGAGGGVFFNTFAASGSAVARAVVTWVQVPQTGGGPPITAQLQLFANGEFAILHDAGNAIASHQALVGVTQGNGATPNPIAFTSIGTSIGSPLDTGANPTAYQEFSASGYDLAGRSYAFSPNGLGGYRIAERATCRAGSFTQYGVGCPALTPVSFYEEFAGGAFDLSGTGLRGVPNGSNGWLLLPAASAIFTGFSNNLGLTDDSVAGPIALPFPFTHPGGTTNVICVSSNGFLWFAGGGSERAFSDHNILLADPPSLAALWTDLNPDIAGLGGGVFADPDPSGQAFYVTWRFIPEYNQPATSNTFQIALFANGNFELRWPSAGTVTHQSVVGYSTGNGAPDPGPIDISAALPFNTGPGAAPLVLAAAAGSRPRLGSTFTLVTSPIPAGTSLGVLLLGFLQGAIDLAPIGMPGCTGYVDFRNGASATTFFATPSASVPFGIAVPNNNALVGFALFAQSATLSSGFNGLGVIASNGGRLEIGR